MFLICHAHLINIHLFSLQKISLAPPTSFHVMMRISHCISCASLMTVFGVSSKFFPSSVDFTLHPHITFSCELTVSSPCPRVKSLFFLFHFNIECSCLYLSSSHVPMNSLLSAFHFVKLPFFM